MKISQKINIARFIIYFIVLGLPILSMLNCSNWSTRDMEVSNCLLDGIFFKEVANFFYSMLFFSAFTLFIPLLIYFGVTIGLAEAIFYMIQIDKTFVNSGISTEELKPETTKVKDIEFDIDKSHNNKSFIRNFIFLLILSPLIAYFTIHYLTQESKVIKDCGMYKIFTKNFSSSKLFFKKKKIRQFDFSDHVIGKLSNNKIFITVPYLSEEEKECLKSTSLDIVDKNYRVQ